MSKLSHSNEETMDQIERERDDLQDPEPPCSHPSWKDSGIGMVRCELCAVRGYELRYLQPNGQPSRLAPRSERGTSREAALDAALRQIVYQDANKCWCIGIVADADVTDIVGELLSEREDLP